MRALQVSEFGSAPRRVELPRPRPRPGETLVRIAAAALGHVDRSVASGTFAHAPALPYVPCTDGAGWVETSATVPRGTLVWLRGGGLGVTRDGVAAEFAAVPDEAVHRAPAGTDPAVAACFFSPAASAHLAVHQLGNVLAGEQVLVTGAAGAVGSLAVQLAGESAAKVTGLVSHPDRAALVSAGADVRTGELEAGTYDLLIDTVGGTALPARLDAVVPGGRAVLVGYTAGTRADLDLPRRLAHDVDLRFLNLLRRAPQAFPVAGILLTRLTAGELHLRVRRYPLAEAAAAWSALAAGRTAGRLVLEP